MKRRINPVASQVISRREWEYKTLTLSLYTGGKKEEWRWDDTKDNKLNASERLNQLGEEGWELVTVACVQRTGTTGVMVYWLKRPKYLF